MTNSILLTVKKMLGIAEEYHAFDLDIILNINSVFLNLNQLGVGPITPYQITGDEETWEDFYGDDPIPGLQTYVYLKVRLAFDPPTNSFLVTNVEKQIAELEWRLNIQMETSASSLDESTNGSVDQNKDIFHDVPVIPLPDTSTPSTFRDKLITTLQAQAQPERRIRLDRVNCTKNSTIS